MFNIGIGIRKYVEYDKVQYWLLINADKSEAHDLVTGKEKLSNQGTPWSSFIHHNYWQIFILITILVNLLITINCFHEGFPHFWSLVIIVHVTCIWFWIDFLVAVTEKIMDAKKKRHLRPRQTVCLVIDAISLLPLSLLYVIIERLPDPGIFWLLRLITLLRFYRIPYFLSNIVTTNPTEWNLTANVFYLVLCIDVFANAWEACITSPISIDSWNSTFVNKFVTCLYFSCVTMLNIGYGDITPTEYSGRLMCATAMILGCSIVTGVITGTLANEFTNREVRRESFRQDYEATINFLRQRKTEKRIVDKTSENLKLLWKNRNGYLGSPPIHILPPVMQKELSFDVNFTLLNRSIIFSSQSRSFLRRVSLMMKNYFFLPGDIIVEPFGVKEAMFCVASGVVEVLAEENDETTLFSVTTGTVLGEAALFISIPVRCAVRASTYVDLRVLYKTHFSTMALEYPEIYRNMRREVEIRLQVTEEHDQNVSDSNTESTFVVSRNKALKRVLQDLRRQRREMDNDFKSRILELYMITENIPRVKAIPLTLISSKPWILRPNTSLTTLWEIFIVLLVTAVVFVVPSLAAFVRRISTATYIFLGLTKAIYITDLVLECITAVEKKDHFSYIASLKRILRYKLNTVGFYFDAISTVDLSVYGELLVPENPDYGHLLLSLNRVLKFWRIPGFFHKLENNFNRNLLMVIFFKYLLYFCVAAVWASCVLYLEACPSEVCYSERWFHQSELNELNMTNSTPCTKWPAIISLYFGVMTITAVGYGDVTARSIVDCLVIICFIFIGTFLMCFCVAQTSSTVKHMSKIRTEYQEQVFAVDRFMREHELSKDLQLKVRNYFQLQWNHDKGFSLRHKSVSADLSVQQRHIIVTELVKIFMNLPIFRETSYEFVKELAKLSRVTVLPPDEMITTKGSYFRDMYILEYGYCEVAKETEIPADRSRKVIGPVNFFGFIEMMLGIPLELSVRTLTHVKIISLDYSSYLRAVTKHPSVKIEIEDFLEREYPSGIRSYDLLVFNPPEDMEMELIRKHQKAFFSKPFINVYKYKKALSKSYWEPFGAWGKLRFFQFLLMPFVIIPNSMFIKTWMTIRISCVLVMGIVAPIHFSLPHQTPQLAIFIMALQGFAWLDMYFMFHLAYYNKNGILMFHPAKTATWYLTGNFAPDLVTTFPSYAIIRMVLPRSQKGPSLIHDAPGLILVFQVYKFFQACYYLETDILRRTEIMKVLKYFPLTVIITNFIASLMLIIECYGDPEELYIENMTDNLQSEFLISMIQFCSSKNSTDSSQATAFRLYVMAVYWMTSTMTACGFGDLAAYNRLTMIATTIISLLGVIIYTYMFASLTGSMISAHSLITKHRRSVKEMMKFMKDNHVKEDLQRRFLFHYEYTWQRAEGGRPQTMFMHVHAALKETIMDSIYQSTVRQVPAFADVEQTVLRVIGNRLDEIYYLRGEVIVKYKDIQEYIYMIYRGKVTLFSGQGSLITTMGSGGLFGNISNKHFSLSSVLVKVTENVDVLRVPAKDLFRALKVYENTKPLVKYLTSQTSDYIEPLKDSEDLDPTSRLNLGRKDFGFEITQLPGRAKSSMGLRTPGERNHMYLKNSIFKAPRSHKLQFFILPDSILDDIINTSVMVMSYLSYTLTLYMVAFQNFRVWLLSVCYIIDLFFWVKVFFTCNYSYQDKYGDYIVNMKKIKDRYLKSKKVIGIDVAANLPIEILSVVFVQKLLALSILRMNRILRLAYIFDYFNLKFKLLMVNKIHLELSWLAVVISLSVHFCACVWYFVACPFGVCQKDSWVVRMSLDSTGQWDLYLCSMYYAILIITTTGYGDVDTNSVAAMLVSVMLLIISRFGIALLVGGMAAIVSVNSLQVFHFRDRIKHIRATFIQQKASSYQLDKMWSYVTLLWKQEAGKQLPKLISRAPYAMKCEVMKAMYGSHLSQCFVFHKMEEPFLYQLAVCLRRFVYFPGNYIVHQGDIDHTMYFIHKGQVSVLTIHPDLMETVHFKLQENDHFGMIQGLIIGKPHSFSYRAETSAEILSLTRSDWQHLLKYFPNIGPMLSERIESLENRNADAK